MDNPLLPSTNYNSKEDKWSFGLFPAPTHTPLSIVYIAMFSSWSYYSLIDLLHYAIPVLGLWISNSIPAKLNQKSSGKKEWKSNKYKLIVTQPAPHTQKKNDKSTTFFWSTEQLPGPKKPNYLETSDWDSRGIESIRPQGAKPRSKTCALVIVS